MASPGPHYRILHCLRGAEVSTILASVRGWLAAHPGEVVLLDLQHLYSFRARDHADLVTRLTQLFGELLCPWTQDLASLTLGKMRAAGTRVIVIYPALYQQPAPVPDPRVLEVFWPRALCPTPWPDTMDPCHLTTYMTRHLASHRNMDTASLFVSQVR